MLYTPRALKIHSINTFFHQRHLARSYDSWPYLMSELPIQCTEVNLDVLQECRQGWSFRCGVGESMASEPVNIFVYPRMPCNVATVIVCITRER